MARAADMAGAPGRWLAFEQSKERTLGMKTPWSLAGCTLAFAAAFGGAASAQDLPQGRVYAFHSQAQGNCPAMDWHIVAEGNGNLAGMISWNSMQNMAKATGTYNARSGTFQMTARELAGRGRTATIRGTVDSDTGWLTASIQGADVKCQGVKVPWFVPYRG
jgi:hypothetical protein